jgi:dicarboxylate transporter 10
VYVTLHLPRRGCEVLLTLVRRMQTSAHKTTFVHAVRDVLHQSGELVIPQTGPGVPSPCPLPSPSLSLCVWPYAHDPGVRGLYTGLTASVFRQMTYSVTRLGAYDALKAMMSQPGKKLSMGELVVCASAAGALGGLAGNPAGGWNDNELRVGRVLA